MSRGPSSDGAYPPVLVVVDRWHGRPYMALLPATPQRFTGAAVRKDTPCGPAPCQGSRLQVQACRGHPLENLGPWQMDVCVFERPAGLNAMMLSTEPVGFSRTLACCFAWGLAWYLDFHGRVPGIGRLADEGHRW